MPRANPAHRGASVTGSRVKKWLLRSFWLQTCRWSTGSAAAERPELCPLPGDGEPQLPANSPAFPMEAAGPGSGVLPPGAHSEPPLESEEVQCFPFVSASYGLGFLLGLAAPSRSLSVCCRLGSPLRAGGVGTSVSGAGTYQRAACAKQSTSFDVLGGRGGQPTCSQSKDTAVEQSRAQHKVRARSASRSCRSPTGGPAVQVGSEVCTASVLRVLQWNQQRVGVFLTWNVLIQRCSGFVLVLCCLLVLQGVGRGWLG